MYKRQENEVIVDHIALRKIEIKDQVIYLNGQKIKFRGDVYKRQVSLRRGSLPKYRQRSATWMPTALNGAMPPLLPDGCPKAAKR